MTLIKISHKLIPLIMKQRLTLTLPIEIISYVKAKAKERNITVSQFAEELFLKFCAEEEAKNKIKKVS